MNRRDFLMAGLSGSAALPVLAQAAISTEAKKPIAFSHSTIRSLFPRLKEETYLNSAGMMPLGDFSREGLDRYLDWQARGGGDGREEYRQETLADVRSLFARLIGAKTREIGLVHCTKAGEQVVLDSVTGLNEGGNLVTNDLHFSGSLHNLVGLRRAGTDVRIVRSKDFTVDVGKMEKAIDEKTRVVSVTLVSNVNGHVEDIKKISKIAHAHGALVYADIIQAAGIVPIDVHDLGIDVAACSCYKWLCGVYGTGFLFVREELQGAEVSDRLFPGYVRPNYPPWVSKADPTRDEFGFRQPTDARRYQPGHISYLGYCAAYEGLRFLEKVGIQRALNHSVSLNRRLLEKIDKKRYPCISPHPEKSPIVSFLLENEEAVRPILKKEHIVVSLGNGRLRVSPAIFNEEGDIDRLVEALDRA